MRQSGCARARCCLSAVTHPWNLDPHRTNPGLYVAFRKIAVPHNPPASLRVDQLRMRRDMRFNFRLNRLGQQRPRTRSQDIRQRIITK